MAPKYLILTFDDGPIADQGAPDGALETILQALRTHEAKAVFYAIGQEVAARPDLARRIVEEGHLIQNHSWDHPSLPTHSREAIRKQLADTQHAIQEATGVTPDRLRPPFGTGFVGPKSPALAEVANELGLRLTGWDVDTNDWRKPRGLDGAKIAPPMPQWEALYNTHQRPLDVLMHVNQATARDLGGFIQALKSEGWQLTVYQSGAPGPTAPSAGTS